MELHGALFKMPLTCVGYSSNPFAGETDLPSRYSSIEHIGQGATCSVVKAHDKFLDRQVAIKILRSELSDFSSVRRFQQEAKMMSSFNLKHLPVVLDFGLSSSGRPFMVMELVDGSSLKQLIAANGQLDIELALEVNMQILSALHHAHERGIVHRDLKSQNVMVSWTQDGKPLIKVVDFGLAGELDRPMFITECGAALGTPFYMSPEQARGGCSDARSDLYSLGCVMFEMLTGHTPFEKSNATETLSAHIHETAPALRLIPGSVSKTELVELQRVVAKLLEKEPSKRYQCVKELQSELSALIETIHADSAAQQAARLIDNASESTLAGFTSWTNVRAVRTNSTITDHRFETSSARKERTADRTVHFAETPESERSVPITLVLLVMASVVFIAAGLFLIEPTAYVAARAPIVAVESLNPVVKIEREAQAQLSEKATEQTKKTFKATIGGKFHISDKDLWALPSLADCDLVLIKDFPTVRNLNLITSQAVTGEGFHQIKTLPIESLDLRGLTISQSGFDAISEMQSLKTLQIDYMPFLTLSKVSKLKSAPALQTLTCRGTHLSVRCQSEIAKFPHLTQLFLNNTSGLNDSSLETFAKITTLKCLSISRSSKLSDESIAAFRKLRPDVKLFEESV